MTNFTKQFETLDLGIHGVRLPSFKVSKEDKRRLGVSEDISNEDFLEALCKDGLQKSEAKESASGGKRTEMQKSIAASGQESRKARSKEYCCGHPWRRGPTAASAPAKTLPYNMPSDQLGGTIYNKHCQKGTKSQTLRKPL